MNLEVVWRVLILIAVCFFGAAGILAAGVTIVALAGQVRAQWLHAARQRSAWCTHKCVCVKAKRAMGVIRLDAFPL